MTSPKATARAIAAAELIGRTGAIELEVGCYHEEKITTEAGGWWASVKYKGSRVFVDHQRSPERAIDALLVRILDGAQCRWCGRLVTNRRSACRSISCVYRLEGASYVRGCLGSHDTPTVPLPPWARR